jgi:hypothetical protein
VNPPEGIQFYRNLAQDADTINHYAFSGGDSNKHFILELEDDSDG